MGGGFGGPCGPGGSDPGGGGLNRSVGRGSFISTSWHAGYLAGRYGLRSLASNAATVIARITARDRATLCLVRELSPAFMLCGVEFNKPKTACAVSRASA